MQAQEQTARHITYVPLEAVRPAERNPKEHDVAHVVGLIRRFGFHSPLIVDDRTQRLLAGHGRVIALVTMRAAGDPMPDGLLMDEDGGWLVPVVRGWTSKNDTEAEAALVSHNTAQDKAGWDYAELAEMVEDITAYDGELFHALDFSTDDMERMFRYTNDPANEGPASLDLPAESTEREQPAGEDLTLTGTLAAAGLDPAELHVECPACHHTFTLGGT